MFMCVFALSESVHFNVYRHNCGFVVKIIQTGLNGYIFSYVSNINVENVEKKQFFSSILVRMIDSLL